MEVLLDEPNLPQIVGGFEILQIIAAVDVDEVELAVPGRVTLPSEPLLEHQVILLGIANELAPNDECSTAVRRSPGDRPKPIWAIGILRKAVPQPQALLAVALECGAEGLRRSNVMHREADQPVKGLQQIDVDREALVRSRPLDLEFVGGGIGESLKSSND